MIDLTAQFKDTFIMYDPEVFDTSMTWKEVMNYKKEKGTSPRGCVVLTAEEYRLVEEMLDKVR